MIPIALYALSDNCIPFQPSAGNNIHELRFLPGSTVTAWQVCFLAKKLTNRGYLAKITFQAGSVILPRFSEIDEAKLTIPRTKVGIVSIETETSIEEIDYLARHMNINKLDLVVR